MGSSLGEEFRLALDRVAFARACSIDPDPWQEQILASEDPRMILNISRQAGKSTMAALLALHRALYYPASLILLLAPALRQSQELYGKVRHFYGEVGHASETVQETALTMRLENGSRIISLPGNEKSIRGYSGASLLIVDEAARVEDALYYSIRPMLAVSGGSLIMASTPWGRRGAFYHEWTQGEGWRRFEIPATSVGRITPEFLAEEEQTLGPRWYRQEYCNSFEEVQDSVFDYESVTGAITEEVAPLFGAPEPSGPGSTHEEEIRPLFEGPA